ncbi:SDR family NAD(P)-dependent oxidoreductase [Devosia sp.]|uniref:SDR family NAD(P)-dependent oxidoreductase n=1 Tax=Devosia sp. TaxID=1871048 RepID=UPI0035B2DB98
MTSIPAFDLSGRAFLVVGGAGYLGTPTGELIARLGGDVVIADISAEKTEVAVAAIEAVGGTGKVSGLSIDIADEASILAVVRQAAARGNLGGVVMSTSGASGKRLDDLTAEDFDRANRINLTGTFLLAREAARHMGQGGSIVLYSSMYGVVAPVMANYPPPMPPNPIEYGAGKAGIVQMVKYLAAHYGRSGIRVNAIVPGPFPHPATVAANPEFIGNLERATMLGRIGAQHETAGPTAFLLSPASSYVTGHVLTVDGGWTAW